MKKFLFPILTVALLAGCSNTADNSSNTQDHSTQEEKTDKEKSVESTTEKPTTETASSEEKVTEETTTESTSNNSNENTPPIVQKSIDARDKMIDDANKQRREAINNAVNERDTAYAAADEVLKTDTTSDALRRYEGMRQEADRNYNGQVNEANRQYKGQVSEAYRQFKGQMNEIIRTN